MARELAIAAAQFPFERPASLAAWQARIERWVTDGASQGAQLLVFPEYAGMELAGLLADAEIRDLADCLERMQDFVEAATAHHADLARRHGVHILQGSLPVRREDGSYRNVATLHAANGRSVEQEKRIMTRFERETWGVMGGSPLRVVDTELGRLGILICYDVEFPLLARAMSEAGAIVLLAPSCTETRAGFWRVRIGCQGRALENQLVTVQAPTIGEAAWCPAVDANDGAAGIFGPPDRGWPANGIIATGEHNRPSWVTATIDLDRIAETRRDGGVLNNRDWAEQGSSGLPPVELVDLR